MTTRAMIRGVISKAVVDGHTRVGNVDVKTAHMALSNEQIDLVPSMLGDDQFQRHEVRAVAAPSSSSRN